MLDNGIAFAVFDRTNADDKRTDPTIPDLYLMYI